jgi:hypothetical protein
MPLEIERLLSLNPFELEDKINQDLLEKYLYYMPEIVRIMGLHIAQLENSKRNLEYEIWQMTNENGTLSRKKGELLIQLANAIDSAKYKNEQMRDAYVVSKPEYQSLANELEAKKKELLNITYLISCADEERWKYRNLNANLDNIAKLRIRQSI